MRYSVLLPAYEGMSYGAQVEAAQAAEELGFDAVFRPDHWLPLSGDLTRGVTDAWATLAGLARETSRVRLGALVSPVTFRGPVEIAKVVATVDEMSGGRVELGLGAGWYDAEHDRFGLHYPAMPERFEMLEEQLAVVRSLWTQPTTDYEGRHYRLHDAILQPKPVQRPHPPIVLGGLGRAWGLHLAAQYADEYNLDGFEPADCRLVLDRLDRACEAVDRDPRSVVRSVLATWPFDGAAATQRSREAAYAAAGIERIHLVTEGWNVDRAFLGRFAGAVMSPT
jgi:F420-dependent oxidoreductase-like protein